MQTMLFKNSLRQLLAHKDHEGRLPHCYYSTELQLLQEGCPCTLVRVMTSEPETLMVIELARCVRFHNEQYWY
jgi:hypothetical protein